MKFLHTSQSAVLASFHSSPVDDQKFVACLFLSHIAITLCKARELHALPLGHYVRLKSHTANSCNMVKFGRATTWSVARGLGSACAIKACTCSVHIVEKDLQIKSHLSLRCTRATRERCLYTTLCPPAYYRLPISKLYIWISAL